MTDWTKLRVNSYIRTLLDKYEERVIVNRSVIKYGDWTPEAKMCRHNVSICCSINQDYSPVHGWLCIENFEDKNNIIFVSHTIVRRASGELRDITPTNCSTEYSFLACYLNEDEYIDLINNGFSTLSTQNLRL
jgi:hypothetical protein